MLFQFLKELKTRTKIKCSLKKPIFIGPINKKKPPLDGETAKNQVLLLWILNTYPETIVIDTFHWKTSLTAWFKILYHILFKKSARLFISAATQSSYRLIRLCTAFNRKHTIHYFVIGNTIAEGIEQGQYDVKYLSICRKIYVEGKSTCNTLSELGLPNVAYLPNFRIIRNEFLRVFPLRVGSNESLRFVFISRIMAEKGTSLILQAIRKLNVDGFVNRFTVTFYGPILKPYEPYFKDEVDKLSNANYGGSLDLRSESGYIKLSTYHVLLLPTYWYGEGFPGAIIDSYIAGLPVIASKWGLNEEVIADGETGFLINANSLDFLLDKMRHVICNPGILPQMSTNCLIEARKYDYTKVLSAVEL